MDFLVRPPTADSDFLPLASSPKKSTVHPEGFEPPTTDPKSVVISISPRVRLNFCANAVSARNVSSAVILT